MVRTAYWGVSVNPWGQGYPLLAAEGTLVITAVVGSF